MLPSAGLKPTSVATNATVTLVKAQGGFAITKVHLDVDAKVPGADQGQFDEIAAGVPRPGLPRLQAAQRRNHDDGQARRLSSFQATPPRLA